MGAGDGEMDCEGVKLCISHINSTFITPSSIDKHEQEVVPAFWGLRI